MALLTRLSAILACAVMAIAPVLADTTPDKVNDAILRDPPPGDWLSYNRTTDESRYSPLDQITTENVKDLGLAWHLDLGTNRGVESTPLYADGVLYVTLPWSDVLAVDARTGQELWRFDAKVKRERGFWACCDVVNRGLAMWEGKLYLGTIDGRLIALDAKTGKQVFSVQTVDKGKPYTITAAPRVIKGKVLIGNGGAEYLTRGYMTAYDARTGKQLWRFYAVPGDPAKGFESKAMADAAKTWTGQWWKFGGGGTMWEGMAYDPGLNLVYVGTGNGSTWSKYLRSPGGGDNLYLCSIVALDVDSGELKWYYQNTPGDTWDYDSDQHMILADLDIGGAKRQVLMQANKNGFFYVLDRANGTLIDAKTFTTVNWASGIDAKTGKPIQTGAGEWKDKPALVFPYYLGGHNWQPMAFSPKTGLVYVPAADAPALYAPDEAFQSRPDATNMGANFSASVDAPPELLKGSLLAWDPVKGAEAWRKPLWGAWNGGALATAGGLVFQGTGNGKLIAYRDHNGDVLWESPAGTGVIAGPMTFEMDGTQHVALMAGWGGAGALALGRAAKAAGVVSYGRLLVFKLGAKAVLPPTPEPPKGEAPKTDATSERLKAGEILYHKTCVGCHGIGAVGGGVIPDLRTMPREFHDRWDEIVLGGALKDNGMVSFKRFLSKAQSDVIHDYIKYRAAEGDTAVPINAKPAQIK